jgi:hypothetical protein
VSCENANHQRTLPVHNPRPHENLP